MKLFTTLFACLASTLLFAQTRTFTPETVARFEVTNMYVNTVEGTVKGAAGTAEYQDDILVAIQGELDASTILSGNSIRDGHLRDKEAFFNVAKSPKISFSAEEVTFVGKSSGVTTYKLNGTLTLRNVANDMEIEVRQTSPDRLEGTFTVNRDLWGLGEGYPKAVIARDVSVTVDIHLN